MDRVHAQKPVTVVMSHNGKKSVHLAAMFGNGTKQLDENEKCLVKGFKNFFKAMMMMQSFPKVGNSLLTSLIAYLYPLWCSL